MEYLKTMIVNKTKWATYKICSIISRYRAKNTYPDRLDIDFFSLLEIPPSLRIAVIDDEEFIYSGALNAQGHKVEHFQSYTKPLNKRKSTPEPYDFSGFDIILCDIHDIGGELYPESEGISVLQELRKKHPLHVIAAYTGDPGAITTRCRQQKVVDKVFSRDWTVDDFLLNFQELVDIFAKPKQRWKFLKSRMDHLDIPESKIEELRVAFVQNVLTSIILKDKFNFSTETTYQLVNNSDCRVDLSNIIKHGITASRIAMLIKPVFWSTT